MNQTMKALIILSFFVGSTYAFFSLSHEETTIERIDITYRHTYFLGETKKHYIVEKRNGEYYSDTGQKIDTQLIRDLSESFTDLYESSEYEYAYEGFVVCDDYPTFNVVVTTADGKIVVSSESNYHCFIPWNVTFSGKTYVQYNGEIPSALLRILVVLDEYWLGYKKLARWGCYPVEPPEKYGEKASEFPGSTVPVPSEEIRGDWQAVWTVDVEEYIICPPVYVDGNIFVAVQKGVLCFDALTGEKIWETDVGDTIFYTPSRGEYVTYVDGNIFVTVKRGVICLDAHTGEKIWEFSGKPIRGPPVHWNNKVYIRVKSEAGTPRKMGVLCLDAHTGQKVWEFNVEETEGFIMYYNQSMLLHEGDIYFGTGEPSVYCLDAESGGIIWKYQKDISSPWLKIFGDKVLLSMRGVDDMVLCLERETGEKVWEIRDVYHETSYDDNLLLKGYDEGPYHVLVDADSGELLWEGRIHGESHSVVYFEEILYFRTDEGKTLVALDTAKMKEAWQYTSERELGTIHVVEQGILVPVTGSFEEIYSGDSSGILLFFDRDGQILWEYHYPGDVTLTRVEARIVQDILFILRRKGFIEAFDVKNGNNLWEIEVRGTFIKEFVVRENKIYVSADDGKVYCLEFDTGAVVWVFDTGSGLDVGGFTPSIFPSLSGREPPQFLGIEGDILFLFTGDGRLCALSLV